VARRARKPKRPELRRVFLGCEGEGERSYGAWLQAIARDLRLHITIDTYPDIGGGGDPLDIVRGCISEMRRRESLYGKYPHRAVLLDSDRIGDDPDRDRRATDLAAEYGVHLIWQEFEHEAFLLRHLPGHENLRPPKGEGREILNEVWPEYRRRQAKITLYEKLKLDDLRRACTAEPTLRTFLTELGFPV